MVDDDSRDDVFAVEINRVAARRFVNYLLDAAARSQGDERVWLLWGVGLIAQAGKASLDGPTP